MKSNDLNTIWIDIDVQKNARDRFLQRMVYVDLLYRAYVGASGIPSKRFLSIEIPEKDTNQFDAFTVPQGFTLSLGEPGVKHAGYATCVLQAASSDQNDVFAVVAQDILDELRKQKEAEKYIETLKRRIEKWREFFKNPARNRLSERMVIGLFGELSFIRELREAGIEIASDLWNGPIKSAQDFQGEQVAIEVKTASSNSLEYVHISSEAQLDEADRNALYLVAYRIERNDATGTTLPELIKQVALMLNEQQRARFTASLTCLGYAEEDDALYSKRYSLKERKTYKVKDGFPRILRADLPQGVMDISYSLALQACDNFVVEFDEIPQAIKEYEYGES